MLLSEVGLALVTARDHGSVPQAISKSFIDI